MIKRNPYEILGLKKGSSSEEIKDAFMNLIKKSKPIEIKYNDKVAVLKAETAASLQSYFNNLTYEDMYYFKLNIDLAKIQIDVIIEKIYKSNREDEIKKLFKAGNLIIKELENLLKEVHFEDEAEICLMKI